MSATVATRNRKWEISTRSIFFRPTSAGFLRMGRAARQDHGVSTRQGGQEVV
jgi:hypothetical protein